MLRTGPGTAIVGGPSMLLPKCPFMPPFAKMPLKQREAILRWWATGPIPLLRKVTSRPATPHDSDARHGPSPQHRIEQGCWIASPPNVPLRAGAVARDQ